MTRAESSDFNQEEYIKFLALKAKYEKTQDTSGSTEDSEEDDIPTHITTWYNDLYSFLTSRPPINPHIPRQLQRFFYTGQHPRSESQYMYRLAHQAADTTERIGVTVSMEKPEPERAEGDMPRPIEVDLATFEVYPHGVLVSTKVVRVINIAQNLVETKALHIGNGYERTEETDAEFNHIKPFMTQFSEQLSTTSQK
jgi:hypothetical protein